MSQRITFKFRLYVAGDAENSQQARANFSTICRNHLHDRFEVEIVDVLREPKRALEDAIFMTPTLVRLMPHPIRKVIGTLGQTQTVLHALGLETITA